ncbi:hypothetical protein [uncultured Paludibaculum sp.]|uniref:hypothetical protein n=1 Tax=uncultured Paludibaculum sp. TaxID=1765020 RepID=UPI002AAB0F0C|nr:hypothetical protein [uncultured Paludibaculum sp.]
MSTASSALPHRIRVSLLVLGASILILWLAVIGFSYYRLPLIERPLHPRHWQLRPSGQVGLRVGLLSLGIFLCLFLYPLRKRWKTLQRIGKTRHWLDIHIILGLAVPILVTFHSSFKLHGLAGMAYWIMMAIVASGIAGRYLYAQIPRSVNAAEMGLRELQDTSLDLSREISSQHIFREADLRGALQMPSPSDVDRMPLWQVLGWMAWLDLLRPLRVARLRRHVLSGGELLFSLGGLRRSSHLDLEAVLTTVRRQVWLTAKILFLRRAGEIFHLWHIVHKPFSYSFAVLVFLHIGLAVLLGYY